MADEKKQSDHIPKTKKGQTPGLKIVFDIKNGNKKNCIVFGRMNYSLYLCKK